MDAIHYKAKENHQYITKAAYVVLGIQTDGRKDILGVCIGENESSKFWLQVMNDLKKVYQAVTEDEAMDAFIEFKNKWQSTYPSCVRSWEENWDILTTFFAYPAEIRKIIYMTNIIEGLNRQFRKITKNKPSFTNDDSLRKILYLVSKNIVGHWSITCRNRDMVSNQLSIMFGDRVTA